MNKQPWKLNKEKLLARIKEFLDADYISIKIVDGSITLEFVNIGRPLIEDEESWVEATIEKGQIKVTHFWGDEGVMAEILDNAS